MTIDNNVLSLTESEWDSISRNIEIGFSPMVALQQEMHKNNIAFNNLIELQLELGQMRNKKIIITYSQVVCSFWNRNRHYC